MPSRFMTPIASAVVSITSTKERLELNSAIARLSRFFESLRHSETVMNGYFFSNSLT